MRRRALILAGAAVLAALACARVSAAPGQAVFALHPEHYDPALQVTESYFVEKGRPGTSFTNAVRVVNTGTAPGTVLLYPVDATTGQTSGAVYLDRTKPRPGVGSWVTLGASSVTLDPGKSALVPVAVNVPAAATPGDHLGGIVGENAAVTQGSGKGALQIRVKHLTIVAVEVQVPGPAVAAVGIAGVRAVGLHGYQFVHLHLTSPGALTTKPHGRLVVTGADGKQVASRAFKLDTFLPGTAIDYPVLLPGQVLAPGDYRAAVELTYGASALGYRRLAGPEQTISRTFPFSVSKHQYTAVFGGVKPVKPPTQATKTHGGGQPVFLIAGILGAFLLLAVLLVAALRRWSVH
jgi:Bacterial protein of unknown function (DUF916)